MTALIADTPTARRELGPWWRDRIEQELNWPGVSETVEKIYDALLTLPGQPTYHTAWTTVLDRHLSTASDIRQQHFQTLFDLTWQMLCEPWALDTEDKILTAVAALAA